MDIILKSAFSWECPKCKYKNFEELQRVNLTIDEREEIYRDLNDLEDWQELPDNWESEGIVAYPTDVSCQKCSTEYNLEPMDEQDGDDDE